LFKISIQGVSLWHFHVCKFYNPDWFISSVFLLSTLVPLLWWFQYLIFISNFHIKSDLDTKSDLSAYNEESQEILQQFEKQHTKVKIR
jgi:hypothetical protein